MRDLVSKKIRWRVIQEDFLMLTSGFGIYVHAQVSTSAHRHVTHIKYTNTAGEEEEVAEERRW